MQLWNDYEGKTLAGIFPIEALLSTEGRNACFATQGRDGRPAVLRLTEALNDQEEMRARYRAIRDVGQRNLVGIEDFGDVEMDGTPLIYVVMEATEENLGEIVRERPLSIDETGEVATSLVSALEALHAHGLVHGHVEPTNVMAAGQVIKLRSDCARAAAEGEGGARARAEDVMGLADVLHRCLTQKRLQDASDALALPEPYASIVRNVLRGSWGLEEVGAEVRRFVRPAPRAATEGVVLPPVATAAPVQGAPSAAVLDGRAVGRLSSRGASEPSRSGRKSVRPGSPVDPQLPLVYASAAETKEAAGPDSGWRTPAVAMPEVRRWLWIAGAVAVCGLVLLIWHFRSRSGQAQSGKAAAALSASVPVGGPAPPVPAVNPPRAVPSTNALPQPPPAPAHGARGGEVWRVIAYTYNGESQARSKAKAIADRHGDLHPQVYSRTGKAPYLVTLGGPLTEQQAATMRQRARSEGLARDVYMQNYSR